LSAVVKALMDALIAWCIKQLENEAVNKLVQVMMKADFQLFEQNIVEDIIDLFVYLGWALLVAGILFSIIDFSLSQIDGNGKDFGYFFKNIFFSILVCSLLKDLAKEMFQFGNTVLGHLLTGMMDGTNNIEDGYIPVSGILQVLGGGLGLTINLIIAVVYMYSIFKILISLYKRAAFFIIHLCIGFFHMFALPSGRWDGFFSWCRLAMGLVLGNVLQVSTYYLGLTIYTTINVRDPVMSVIICLAFMSASADIDKLLVYFGVQGSGTSIAAYGNSVRRSASSVVRATSKVVNIVK
jgi:hypothetical protein